MSEVSELLTIITADNKKFIQAINESTNAAKGFAGQVTSFGKTIAGGLGFAAVTSSLKNMYNTIDDLATAANKLDINVASFQELSYAAQQSDVSISTLESGLKRLRTSVAQAQGGNKKFIESFAAVGISVQDLNKPIDELYKTISKSMQGKSSQEQVGLVNALFGGRAGQEQLNLLRNDMTELAQRFREVGQSLSSADISTFAELDTAVNDASTAIKTSLMQAFIAVAPAITVVANLIAHTLKQLRDFVSAAGELQSIAQSMTGSLLDKITGNTYDPNAPAPFDPAATVYNFKGRRASVGTQMPNGQTTQPVQINVQVDASPNLITNVVNSPQNKNVIIQTSLNTVAEAAMAGVR